MYLICLYLCATIRPSCLYTVLVSSGHTFYILHMHLFILSSSTPIRS